MKTPGDGRTYSVGTIEVLTTDPQNLVEFSGHEVRLPLELAAFTKVVPRQIVLLQCRGPQGTGPNADQSILWQRFFYGESGTATLELELRAANGRGISVWPGANPADTRIAICGETYDSRLRRNQFDGQGGWSKLFNPGSQGPHWPIGLPSGYIAVFNGDGRLLWTHQFFFEDPGVFDPEGACAITDVSIRIEDTPQGQRDVVTYCGISSFGLPPLVPNEASALTPFRAFLPPPPSNPPVPGYVPAGGASSNGHGQWDGIVGRISNVHANPVGSGTAKEFHAIVGGSEQDGLWGIVEISPDRFATVGSTAVLQPAGPAGPATFPLTPNWRQVNWNAGQYAVGVVLVFDASQTRLQPPNDLLVLESSEAIGSVGSAFHTHAADVCVQLEAVNPNPPPVHRLAVAGTTDDPGLFGSLWNIIGPSATAFAAPTDGFLVTALPAQLSPPPPPGVIQFLSGTFQGGPGTSGWSGVGVWNEYLDHLAVSGFESAGDQPVQQDLVVSSVLADRPGATLLTMVPLRGGGIPATPIEVPAKAGSRNATVQERPFLGAVGLDYLTFGLGPPAGGGVSVDERARVNVVGATEAAGYPTLGAFPLARGWRGGQDAIRTVATMLPVRVGRSDTTGEQLHNGVGVPPPPAGLTGRTTPTCALLPFGKQIGVTPVGSTLPRMMIDWEGQVPGATQAEVVHWLLVDRPRSDTQAYLSVIQFGVPTVPATDPVTGIENWLPFGVTHSFATGPISATLRIPLVLPPATPGTATFSMQVVTFLASPLTCTGQGLAASPAIVFSY